MPKENLKDQTITFVEPRVIAFRPQLAKYLGSIEAALYHQQLTHWQQYAKRTDGFFYKSSKEIEEETCISERQQRRCRKLLVELGWIETKKLMANGHPTYHYKVIMETFSVVIPTGKMPVPIGQNASSITKTTTSKEIYKEKELAQATDLHTGYVRLFKINYSDWSHSDPERQAELMSAGLAGYKLTDQRLAKAVARLRDAGYNNCKKAIINADKSDWNHGSNPSGWKMDLYKYLFRNYEQVEDWSNRE